jgi:hypothetical protein
MSRASLLQLIEMASEPHELGTVFNSGSLSLFPVSIGKSFFSMSLDDKDGCTQLRCGWGACLSQF